MSLARPEPGKCNVSWRVGRDCSNSGGSRSRMDTGTRQHSADFPRSTSLLTSLLKQVSRSFYLTLRFLPGSIRPQIGVAYLLARATDTIADTAIVPLPARLEALEVLRGKIVSSPPPENERGNARPGSVTSRESSQVLKLVTSAP